MKLTAKLAADGHLTAEQVERIGRNVRDFMDALDRDPALKKEAMEKLGAWESAVGKLPKDAGFFSQAYARAHDVAPILAGSAALGGIIGLGTEAGRSLIGSIRDNVQKAQAYRTMINENPNLADADPNLAEKAFNTLFRFNPSYAKDPLVAGTFVKNVIDQERLDIGTVSNLVQARRHMAEGGGGGKGGGGMSDVIMKAMMGAAKGGGRGGDEDGGGGGQEVIQLARNMADAEAARAQAERDRGEFFRTSEQVPENDPRIRK